MINRLVNATRLKSRIYFGYAILGAFATIALGASFVSLLRVESELAMYAESSDTHRRGLEISEAMVGMHHAVWTHIYQGHASANSRVDDYYKKLNRLVRARQLSSQYGVLTLSELQSFIESYHTTFVSAKRLRTEQIALTDNQIPNIRAELLGLIEEASSDAGNDRVLSAKSEVMLADEAMHVYFDSLAGGQVEYALEALSRARAVLATLKQPGAVLRALENYEQSTLKAVQGVRGYTYLLNVVMAGRAHEILYQASELATLSYVGMDVYDTALDQSIQRAIATMTLIFSALIFLSFVMAMVIGRSITLPIERMATTFRQLESGLSDGAIPKFDSDDELGELSRAAAVFRDKNDETQLLLEKYQALSEGLELEVTARTEQLSLALDEAEAATKAKSAFLANMSHEIRTPVHALQGQLQLLEGTPLTPQQANYARQARISNKALVMLLDDILDFSKIASGRMALEDIPINLFLMLEELEVLFEGQAQDKGLAFSVIADADFPEWARGDVTRLMQVLMNLLSNALKFTSTGVVQLRAQAHGSRDDGAHELSFEVRDTGIGIPADRLEAIYEEFSQAEETTTRLFGGTGLGLAIARSLVGAMGGDLTVSSVLGEGTSFTVRVSLAALTAQDEQVVSSSLKEAVDLSSKAVLAGLRVLLVEDNTSLQVVTQTLLEEQGANVKVAGNGRVALTILGGDEIFDIVLMDMQMPELGGLEATQLLRRTFSKDQLPVITMTANATSAEREAAVMAGANEFLPKPLDFNDLCAVLKSFASKGESKTLATLETLLTEDLCEAYPGFDVVTAVARMSGSVDVYCVAAQVFIDGHTDMLVKLRDAVSAADDTRAAALSHELRGSASLLGAQSLLVAVEHAELVFQEKQPSRAEAAVLVSTVVESCEAAARALASILIQLKPYRADDSSRAEAG